MNANSKKNKPGQTTSIGLKRTLIALLIISSLAGHASTAFFSFRVKSGIETLTSQESGTSLLQSLKTPEKLEAVLTENIGKFQMTHISGVQDLFRDAAEPVGTLHSFTFQGTLSGEDGAIAIINDRPIAVDAEIDGVRVAAISDRMVVLEYQKNTKDVLVGETVSIYIED